MVDAKTISVYDNLINDYLNLNKGEISEHLLYLIEVLGAGAKVLDLGCGPATSSFHMREAGLIPFPFDASAEMVTLANKMHNIDAQIGTFDMLNSTNFYDGVWAHFSLLHAKKADFKKHLIAIHKALRKNGLFILGMKLGKGSKRDSLGRFYSYYSAKELSLVLRKTGFIINNSY